MRGYHYSFLRVNGAFSRAIVWFVAAGAGALVFFVLQTCFGLSQ